VSLLLLWPEEISTAGGWTLENTAEGGTDETTVTAGNSGGTSGTAWTSVTIDPTCAVVYDTAQAAHGTVAYRVSTGATTGQAFVRWTVASVARVYGRMYFRLSALGSNRALGRVRSTGATQAARWAISAADKLELRNAANGLVWTSTSTLAADTWYRLEYNALAGASGQVTLTLYAGESTTAIETSGVQTAAYGSDIVDIDWGQVANGPNLPAMWIDSIAASTAGALGPVSAVALANSAEGGTDELVPTTGNTGGVSGDAFSSVSITGGGSVVFDTATAAHGSTSYRFAGTSTSGTAGLTWTLAAARASLYLRTYLRLSTGARNRTVVHFYGTASANTGRIQTTTDDKITILGSSLSIVATSTTVLSLEQWYRLEAYVVPGASGQITVRIYLADSTTPLETLTSPTGAFGTDILSVGFGQPNAGANLPDMWLDSLALASAGWIGADTTPRLLTSADTGTGTDTGEMSEINLFKSSADTAAATEAATVASLAADTAAGAEAATLAAAPTGADSAAGTETHAVGVATADTGTGADAAVVAVAVTGADAGAFADESPGGAAERDDGDTAAAVEEWSVTVATAAADSGAGVDTIGVHAPAGADAAVGSDAELLTVAVAAADTVAGDDTAPAAVDRVLGDTAAGVEAAAVTVAVTAADTGTGADAELLDNGSTEPQSHTVADTVTAAETAAVTITVTAADTGTGADAVAEHAVTATAADTGTGADTRAAQAATATGADTAAVVVEAGTVTLGGAGADSAFGTDTAAAAAALAGADTAAATETATVTATVTSADAGAGAEAHVLLLPPVDVTDTDTGAFTDAVSSRTTTGTTPATRLVTTQPGGRRLVATQPAGTGLRPRPGALRP